MAHLATKRFNYWTQLAILAVCIGVGLMFGGFASYIPLLGKFNLADLKSTSPALVTENLFKPENAAVIRWMTFIFSLTAFFLPPVVYAFICHKKAFMHLGFKKTINLRSAGLIILIMLAALPIVSALQELTEMLPWSKGWLSKFKAAEELYSKQVGVIARMNSFSEYLIAVLVIAVLPAVFEETLFRGGIQNLLSRWFKIPLLAIVATSIIFSAVHGSYLGFLSRFALGFLLGWIYYRTGNIWLNILGHFLNNALVVTVLYLTSTRGGKPDPATIDENFPLWVGLVALAVVYGLFLLLEKIGKKEIDRPGEEVPIPGIQYTDDFFEKDTAHFNKTLH